MKHGIFARPTVWSAAMVLTIFLCLALFAGPQAFAQADPNAAAVKELLGAPDNLSLGVDWASLFTETGTAKDEVDGTGAPGSNGVADYQDLYGGIDAQAIEDRISAGVAVDMSKITGGPSIAECVVHNDTVTPAHDQGNSYMYATYNDVGDLVVYFGVERLQSATDTHLEIELNQRRVRVATGAPWPVKGGRLEDDLLVRVDYAQGVVSSVDVKRWTQGGFGSVATYGGLAAANCNGAAGVALFCSGAPPIAAPHEAWDSAGNALTATSPDDFVEIGVNVRTLLGANFDYTAIQVRTPEDIAFGNFQAIGELSN